MIHPGGRTQLSAKAGARRKHTGLHAKTFEAQLNFRYKKNNVKQLMAHDLTEAVEQSRMLPATAWARQNSGLAAG